MTQRLPNGVILNIRVLDRDMNIFDVFGIVPTALAAGKII